MKPQSGVKVNQVSIFDLALGMEVFDPKSNRNGVIVNIKETNYEEVEAFVKMDGDKHVVKTTRMKDLVIK